MCQLLAQQLAEEVPQLQLPNHVRVFGGRCGTPAHHLRQVRAASPQPRLSATGAVRVDPLPGPQGLWVQHALGHGRPHLIRRCSLDLHHGSQVQRPWPDASNTSMPRPRASAQRPQRAGTAPRTIENHLGLEDQAGGGEAVLIVLWHLESLSPSHSHGPSDVTIAPLQQVRSGFDAKPWDGRQVIATGEAAKVWQSLGSELVWLQAATSADVGQPNLTTCSRAVTRVKVEEHARASVGQQVCIGGHDHMDAT
mmetsp:Transcript_92535/g.299184  ORF Transcript_92535/g.299184 Transcript_92535/m.299184 type:complete len:252 (-) Transcript_92535:624-1379(-)